MRYTKKPVTIEAVQWTGENWDEIRRFLPQAVRVFDMNGLRVKTLEGELTVSKGDYIIKGVHGEFYPCKPDIFAKTYEPEGAQQDALQANSTSWKQDDCPFCGNKEISITTEGPFKSSICLLCGARGPQGHTDREAVVFWNGRAEVEK